jgi:hypothetical protein
VPEASTSTAKSKARAKAPEGTGDYVVPMVHMRVSRAVVDAGFWSGLAGAVALGLVDPPLGVLLGAGVVVARHGARR